jgi:hypothetical protein
VEEASAHGVNEKLHVKVGFAVPNRPLRREKLCHTVNINSEIRHLRPEREDGTNHSLQHLTVCAWKLRGLHWEVAMGRSMNPQGRVAADQMDLVRQTVRSLTERLDDDQVLDLSEMLHDILRRRRGRRSFASFTGSVSAPPRA